MRKLAALALTLGTFIITGCGYNMPEAKEPDHSGQSYAEALRVMCDVDKVGSIAEDDPFEAGRKRGEVISANVLNGDAIYFRTMLSVKGAAEQAADLRKEAKDCGIDRCALADNLEKTGAGGLSP